MSVERPLLQLPEQYFPAIDSLPRDMQAFAEALEHDFPGQAVLILLSLAQRVGGAWYYVPMLDKLSKDWRNDTIRSMYDSGEYTAKDLGRIWRLSHRQIQNILAAPSNSQQALAEKQLKLF